ncbi:hypothetical protein BDN71DRAFT_1445348 [Pleurotus eryngii]|uniref:Uncharacterized protein n=1 Tax=Pleurotus eryngii TaxID=5323 RepID=A0A9P6DA21_PLEER|nr:hypothetical protein BDN71DRAFT_1445348 [Pleurotus eryngii]
MRQAFEPSMFPNIGFSESQDGVVVPPFTISFRSTTTTIASVSIVTEATTVIHTSSVPATTTQTAGLGQQPTGPNSPRGASKQTSIGLGVGLGLVLLMALSYIVYRYRLLSKLKTERRATVDVEPYDTSSGQELGEVSELNLLNDAQPLSRGKLKALFFRPNIRLVRGMRPANRYPDMNGCDSITSPPSYHSRM